MGSQEARAAAGSQGTGGGKIGGSRAAAPRALSSHLRGCLGCCCPEQPGEGEGSRHAAGRESKESREGGRDARGEMEMITESWEEEGGAKQSGTGSHQRSSEMSLWVLPQYPVTPCFPLRALSFGSSSGGCGWEHHAGLRVQFQQAAACVEPGGCRDTALLSRPGAPVRAHMAPGSIAVSLRCRLSACQPRPLSFLVKLVLDVQQPHLSSSLLPFFP